MPAGTTLQTCLVVWSMYRWDAFSFDGSGGFTCTLSDASAGPLSVTRNSPLPSVDEDMVIYATRISFRAASNGQTMKITMPTSMHCLCAVILE